MKISRYLSIVLLRNCYYLFDSHSRDERGFSVVDGTSVLMKFMDLYELEKYLQVLIYNIETDNKLIFSYSLLK